MILNVKNIGKVKSSLVEINGITVIAGENDTGKSTVGKALFAVFNSFYNIEKKIKSERINSVENQLMMMYRNLTVDFFMEYNISDLARNIVKNTENVNCNKEDTIQIILNTISHYDEEFVNKADKDELKEVLNRIYTILKVKDDDIFKTVLEKKLRAEFNEQISNIYSDEESTITLNIRNELVEIKIKDNEVISINKRINLGTEAIYIDDPFILDDVSNRIWRQSTRYADHRTNLRDKLFYTRKDPNVVEEIVANSKFEYIYQKVSSVCHGDVIRGKRMTLGFRVEGTEKVLDVKNLSTGLKSFAILKKLLTDGWIEDNGTIILDEPEIHLHPEWQLLFAELIVLLHKEFGLHILLNTHSPYFLNAIEVYAAKYGIDDKCKYYLAKNSGNTSSTEDVTENIEEIYSILAKPLQDLENERYRL